MDNMIMGDIVKEETTLPSEEVSIDCGGRASLKVPLLPSIMRENWVGMVQVSNHNNWRSPMSELKGKSTDHQMNATLTPVGYQEPRHAVEFCDVGSPIEA